MEIDALKSDLLKRREEHLRALNELDKDIDTIESIKKKYQINGTPVPHPVALTVQFETAGAYPKGKTWLERVLFLITEIKTGTAEDVARRLIVYEPEMSFEKAKKNTTYYLSALGVDQKISYVREGKFYKYSVKE